MDAISVSGLRKRYEDVQAVDDVSFAVPAGETFGILGPNGAGKTTTLEMIEGLTAPDAGDVRVLGEPTWPEPGRVQAKIGVQLQSTALFENLDATELLDLFAKFYGVDPAGRAERLLAQVGLADKAHTLARRMSGGQQQRLAIALALVHDPPVVFLDEPTTGLDPKARRNLWDVVRTIAAEGRTVVLTTHYMEEAEVLCERVAIMDAGRIVALDTPQALIRDHGPRSSIVFAAGGLADEQLERLPGVQAVMRRNAHFELPSDDPQRTLTALIELANREGVEMEGLAVRQPSLEDVFLTLTGREYEEE